MSPIEETRLNELAEIEMHKKYFMGHNEYAVDDYKDGYRQAYADLKAENEKIEKLKAENALAMSLLREKDKTINKLTRQRDVMKKALEIISNNENNFKIITAINALKEAEGME